MASTAEWLGFRPTYWVARLYVVWPASRGSRKKIQNVMMLTMTSKNTAVISRRIMNVTTVAASGVPTTRHWDASLGRRAWCWLRLGYSELGVVIHAVVRLDEDVGQAGAAVQQGLGVDDRHDDRVLHHLHVDLVGDGGPQRQGAGRALHLDQPGVDLRVVDRTDVVVAR